MDNPNTPALNEDAGEETSEPTTPVDEPITTEEDSEPEVEATAETDGEEKETVDSSHKGANARIRELNAKAKSAEEKAQSLAEKLAELTDQGRSYEPQAQYQPQVEPGAEISQEQYRNDIMNTANSIVELKLKQNDAINRIDNEAQQVMRDYPELDPDSDTFDRELSDSINEAVVAHVTRNPYSASPKEFVTKMMKPYRRAVAKGVGKETENIARQVSQSAVRPTAVSSKEKTDSELTVEELEAKYGLVY
jgi:hypothetical protein